MQGEVKEATDLVDLLNRDLSNQRKEWTRRKEALRQIENELAPARAAVAALIQENVSGIDVELGRLSERQRQITRLCEFGALNDPCVGATGADVFGQPLKPR